MFRRFSTVQHYTDPLGQFESAYKTGGGFTFGTEIPVSKILGVEAAYGLVRNNLAVTDYTLSPPAESAYGVRGQRISGDLVGHAPIFFLGFKPYLAAGVEYDRYSALCRERLLRSSMDTVLFLPLPVTWWASITAVAWKRN